MLAISTVLSLLIDVYRLGIDGWGQRYWIDCLRLITLSDVYTDLGWALADDAELSSFR